MSQNSPNLDLPYLQPSQAQKHVTHNEALRRLDLTVQLRLQQSDAILPPDDPAEGAIYALGSGATAAWAGQDGRLAAWIDAVWQFIDPQDGWRAWDIAGKRMLVRDAGAWIAPVPDLNNLAGVGIGTGADATNRLAVAAAATLLSHDGGGHQLKVNKAADTDTASLLFQSDWTGHAEMGLAGQTDFSIKVSADGAAWTEALRFDGATGLPGGSAVQSGATDATAGRLMRVGAFGWGEAAGSVAEISDIDATTTPGGVWRAETGTPNTASLPASLQGGTACILVMRHSVTSLTQFAWRQTGASGLHRRVCASGTWGAWRQIYETETILGTVSQSGGIPTGAIIERGANGNGSYVRYADGTQMCWHTQTQNTDITVALFGGFRSSSILSWTFPAAFSVTPVPLANLTGITDGFGIVATGGNTGTNNFVFTSVAAQATAANRSARLFAIGRWF